MHQLQSLALYFLNHYAEDVLLPLLIFRKKNKSSAVFSLLRHRYSLQQNKLVGYLQHDTRAIAGLVVCTLCTAVAHILEHFQRIVDQIMAFVAVDVNHHTYATGIVFVGCIIQSISHLLLSY